MPLEPFIRPNSAITTVVTGSDEYSLESRNQHRVGVMDTAVPVE